MPDSENKLDLQAQRVLHDPGRSKLQKYALLTVGTPSAGALLRHEFITGLLGGWPGGLGYFLRQKAYRCLFAKMGRNVVIGRNVTIRGAGRITLGDGVMIDDNCVIDARGEAANISIGRGVFIGRNTIVRCRGESLRIGDYTDIGCNCIVATDSRLEIGSDGLIAAYTYIAAGGTHKYEDKAVPINKQGFVSRGGVTIGDDVWIGAHSTVLDGASIGRGSVIGAHSLVNKPLPEMSVAHGIPVEVKRQR